jgi:hypothetical protein
MMMGGPLGGMPVAGPDGVPHPHQPRKAVPDWLAQEILKRKVEAERRAAQEAERKARRLRGSDTEGSSGSDASDDDDEGGRGRRGGAQRRASIGGTRWGGEDGPAPAKPSSPEADEGPEASGRRPSACCAACKARQPGCQLEGAACCC